MIELAKKLIAIDSSPTFGTSKICNFLNEHLALEQSGMSVEVQDSESRGTENCNIIIKINQQSKKQGLLFVAHLDTPDPGIHGLWEKNNGNPFEMSIYGDYSYGLGVVAKFNFLSVLKAMEVILAKKIDTPVTLVGTHSEEDGLVGVKEFLEQDSSSYFGSVVLHPTNLQLLSEGLGLSVFEIEIPFSDEEKSLLHEFNQKDNSFTQSKVFRGRAAHSSTPNLGESAIQKMFHFLENMPNVLITSMDGGVLHNTVPEHSILEFITVGNVHSNTAMKALEIYKMLETVEEKFKDYPHKNYPTQVSTLNVGKIRTDNQSIKLTTGCRLLPSIPEKTYRNWVLDIKKQCEKLGAEVKFRKHFPSFNQNRDSEWVTHLLEVVKVDNLTQTGLISAMSCSEANIIAKHGIATVLFGAGEGAGNTHQPNESISLKDVKLASQLFEHLITKSCL